MPDGAVCGPTTLPENEIVAPPAKFDAVTVKLYGPDVVGVPVITPAVLSKRPAGNAPPVTANVGAGKPLHVPSSPPGALPKT
jgi:hypothetical protein